MAGNLLIHNMPQEYISTSKRAAIYMSSLLRNQAASTDENLKNVEIKISETTENPVDTELDTSLEPKPSTREGSSVQQESVFFGSFSCKITIKDNVVMIQSFRFTLTMDSRIERKI